MDNTKENQAIEAINAEINEEIEKTKNKSDDTEIEIVENEKPIDEEKKKLEDAKAKQ